MSVSFDVPVIGLVGGIGSGKSTIAKTCLRLRPAWRVLDADGLGHEVLRTTEVKTQLHATFGSEIFDENGEVNRPKLGRLVFGSEERSRRDQLEAIVHPLIRRRMEEQVAAWKAAGDVEVILLDAAILLEAGWRPMCDAVVFIDVPREERLRRVIETRGWSSSDLEKREASQLDISEKQRLSEISLRNLGDPQQVAAQLISYIDSLRSR